jgi:hypothetical protein
MAQKNLYEGGGQSGSLVFAKETCFKKDSLHLCAGPAHLELRVRIMVENMNISIQAEA